MARGNAPVALVSHEARYQLGLDVTGIAVKAAEAEAKKRSAMRALRRAPHGQVSERGSTAIGYVGLVVIAAMIVGALYLAVAQSSLAQHVRAGVCRIITPDQVCEAPVSAQTPYERATSGAYVAMGDSYASGEGAENYLEGTDYDHRDEWHRESWEDDKHNRCHRSGNAYAETIGRQNQFDGGHQFVACSGARRDDLNQPNSSNDDENPQMDALSEDTSFVTVSIGGNDLGFADVVRDCVENGENGYDLLGKCQAKHNERIAGRLKTLKDELIGQYRDIREKAPNARVVIVGYPELFVENPRDKYAKRLSAEDQVWMNEKAGELNQMLREVARDSGAEFIDPTDAFRGHGIGSDDPWINSLTFKGPGASLVNPGSFHPNAAGHQALADLVQQQMENPEYP